MGSCSPTVQLLQLLCISLLHRFCNARHGASSSGKSSLNYVYLLTKLQQVIVPHLLSSACYHGSWNLCLKCVVSFCAPEPGHPAHHLPDPQPDHGGLPALLAAEETQQEGSQTPQEAYGRPGAAAPRAGPAGVRHEHIFGMDPDTGWRSV